MKEKNWNGKESETEHIKKEERRGDKKEIKEYTLRKESEREGRKRK